MADLMGTKMVSDGKTAREIFDAVMANPARKKFGFGEKLAIVNVDIQRAYTDLANFKTSYETDPDQIAYVNRISALARAKGMPVIWSRVASRSGSSTPRNPARASARTSTSIRCWSRASCSSAFSARASTPRRS